MGWRTPIVMSQQEGVPPITPQMEGWSLSGGWGPPWGAGCFKIAWDFLWDVLGRMGKGRIRVVWGGASEKTAG